MSEALQITQLVTNIIVILLLLGFTIFLFIFIKKTKQVSQKFEELSSEVKDFRKDLSPLIDTFNKLGDKFLVITSKVDDTVDLAKSIVERGKEMTDDVVEFEQKIKKNVEPSIMETIYTYSALVKGVKTFIDRFKNHSSNGASGHSDLDIEAQVYSDEIREEYADINKELNEVREKLEELKRKD